MNSRKANWIWIFLSAVTLMFAAMVLYDMQTSEGIGLYFALKAGAQDRIMYDLAAAAVGMLLLLAALVIPCILLKRLQPASFFRLLCGYLAFLPSVSTSELLHLLIGTYGITVRPELLNGNPGFALKEGLAAVAPALALAVPLLLLAAAVEKNALVTTGGESVPNPSAKQRGFLGLNSGWCVVLVVQVLLVILAVLFPVLTTHCSFLCRYLLLLEGFVIWERLWDKYPGLNTWGWILFGGCFLRGLYMMMEVMSMYHI